MPKLNEKDTKGNPGTPPNHLFSVCYPLKLGYKTA